MSQQFSMGQQVKVVGPARIELTDPPTTWWYVMYGPWGTVVQTDGSYVKVHLNGMTRGFALHYPPENLLDYFTAICQDAIDDTTTGG